MKLKTFLSLTGIALLSVSIPAMADGTLVKIHGHITDPTGQPKKDGAVNLTTDGGTTLSKISCPVSATGDFSCDGFLPGTYSAVYRQPDTAPGKLTDIIEDVKLEAGGDVRVDFDMSRKAYIDKMTPEEKKQVEEFKKKNADIMKNNQMVKQLNTDLNDARTDNHDKKFADAETLMLKDTALKPDGAPLWYELGVAQIGLKKWEEAETSMKKTVDLASDTATAPNKKLDPDMIGGSQAALGEIYARLKKPDDAVTQYDLATKANPARSAFYLKNETVVFQQLNNADAQAASAEKAIAANPTDAVLYYLKGQALLSIAGNTGKLTVDPKTNMLVLPPGCADAYNKYLELDPNGPYAKDVKDILASAGTKIETKVSNKKR